MARGDMAVETASFGTGTEILNRPTFEGVPMTIDCSTTTAGDDGKKDS